MKATLAAIDRSQAMIEFSADGTIITANENFLKSFGYDLNEIVGRHHRIFVAPEEQSAIAYQEFWEKLRRGEYQTGQFRRIARNGRNIWIEGSYNPIIDKDGKISKIIKISRDITEQKILDADYKSQIIAMNKSYSIIEFSMDGTILAANDHFLKLIGYDFQEIKGRHHSIFINPETRETTEYQTFWSELRNGKYQSAQYKRIGKNGIEVWLEASYNPILDFNGKPYKIVKIATDITKQKMIDADYTGQISAINKSQAVIQFTLDGTILDANDLFLKTMSYSIDEIKGLNHSIFVDDEYKNSAEYKNFWDRLRHGRFDAHVYKRLNKYRKEIWIQASYNPIFDLNGKPYKIVKYATNITDMINLSESTSQNVQAVAAATEEMAASIAEIGKNTNLSKQATDEIVHQTATSSAAADGLMVTMKSMENIASLIANIAGQVNLLALNATIEAARAGDAGKGFAVVASEVKNLANQTATATDEIAKQICTVQHVSSDVVSSIRQIINTASAVDKYVSSVAVSIMQQNEATREISENSQRAAQAVEEITNRVKKVA